MDQCKSQEIVIVMGDFNCKVGEGLENGTVGAYGLGQRNERGEKFIEWCKANNQVVTNTWFQQPKRRLWTWRHPDGHTKNQIDYITIGSRFRNGVISAKTYPSADCESDHIPVVADMRIKLKKLVKGKPRERLDYSALSKSAVANEFKLSVKNQYEVLKMEDLDEWSCLSKAMQHAAQRIPKVKKTKRKPWITDAILAKMAERQSIQDRNSDKYKTVAREVRRLCRNAKENWFNDQCNEIERLQNTSTKEMFARIKTVTGSRRQVCSGCVASKDGNILVEKEEVLKRWSEYINELFHDERGDQPRIFKNFDGPEILPAEIQKAMCKMKRNKACGPDQISIEMITALDDFGIKKDH